MLVILAGLYAIIFKKLSLTRNLSLVEKKARIYGISLILLFIPYRIITSIIISFIVPAAVLTNVYVKHGLGLILSLIFIFLLVIPFKEKLPKDGELAP